jgi:hypothetical protein
MGAMSPRLLVIAVVLCLSRVALADGTAPGQTGIFFGARAGYAIPGGQVMGSDGGGQGTNLSEGFTGLVPFALELGYRVIPNLSVGATLQYGFGLIKNQGSCGKCSGHDISFGANVYLHAAPDGSFDPWVGVGVGYESLGVSGTLMASDTSFATATFDTTLTGVQFLNVQLGGDFALTPLVSAGPFLGVSFGRYGNISATSNFGGRATIDGGGGSQTMSQDIDNTAVHEWFTFGLRGRFNL